MIGVVSSVGQGTVRVTEPSRSRVRSRGARAGLPCRPSVADTSCGTEGASPLLIAKSPLILHMGVNFRSDAPSVHGVRAKASSVRGRFPRTRIEVRGQHGMAPESRR
jgi:hypothetical protein